MPDQTTALNESPARVFADLGLAVADQLPQNERWIPLVPIGTWDHPEYGQLEITPATIAQMHGNHQAGLPGIDLPIDIEHRWGEAAGWLVRTEPRADALWGLVRFNDFGMQLVQDQRYRYISPEWYPKWKDPQTGTYYDNVLTSIALTNRPFFKDLPALVASEIDGKRVLISYHNRIKAGDPGSDNILTGADHMPEDKPKNDTPDQTPKPDPGVISMAEHNAAKKEAADARTEAATATKAAADATARLDRAELKTTIGAMRFGDDNRRAYAPAMVDHLTDVALRFAAGEERNKFLESIKGGIPSVDLSERGSGEGADSTSADDEAKIIQAVQAKQTATPGLSFSDALKAVAAEQPALFAERKKRAEAIRGA